MASKTAQTKTIRKRKARPNKINLKKMEKQIRTNLEVLRSASEAK